MNKTANDKHERLDEGISPRNFDELREHVAASQASLPKRLAQAIQYALTHPDEIALGTAASIASAASVQPSTLVRLARHLGYDGFSDFQLIFRDRLKNRASSYEDRLNNLKNGISEDSHEGALLNGFLQAARQSIDAMSSSIDAAEFARCVSELAKADTIYIVARRRAYSLASQMAYAFAKLGIKSLVVDTSNGIDQELVRMASATDAVIACSFAPYTPASLELTRSFIELNVPVVAITDSALSPLAGMATHWLEVAEHDFAGFRSLSAGMVLAMALPVAVAERRRLNS